MKAARYLILSLIVALVGYMVYDYQFKDLLKDGTGVQKATKKANERIASETGFQILGDDKADEPEQEQAKGPSGFLKYTDKNGVIHYTNDADSIPAAYRDQAEDVALPSLNIEKTQADDGANTGQTGFRNTRIARVTGNAQARTMDATQLEPDSPYVETGGIKGVELRTPVLLYGTPWCEDCAKVRKLFATMKVEYSELDVEKDTRVLRDMLELTGGQGRVPVVKIGAKVIRGYQPEEIMLAIKRSKK